MNENDWRKALGELKEDLVSVKGRADKVSKQLPGLSKIFESLKIDILTSKLEKERRQLARVRGFTAFNKDKKKLGISLVGGLIGMVIMAALNNDHDEAPNRDHGGASNTNNDIALSGGMRVFDSCLQGFGKSKWAVSLDRAMLVVPRDQIVHGRLWVPWESFIAASRNLRAKALAGQHLGDLDAIISELKKGCQMPPYSIKVQSVKLIRRGNC